MKDSAPPSYVNNQPLVSIGTGFFRRPKQTAPVFLVLKVTDGETVVTFGVMAVSQKGNKPKNKNMKLNIKLASYLGHVWS